MIDSLAVSLDDTQVGVLHRFEDENYRFVFDQAWLDDPQRPILGQLFEDRRPDPIDTSGLPCWFAHVLPQGPLRRMLERQAGIKDQDDFDLLTACGDDLPGALRVRPLERALAPQGLLLRPPREPPLAAGRFRFSLAGTQWKMSLRSGERGLVIPVHGEMGNYIGKFQDPVLAALPRVEYATSRWAQAAGVEMPPTRLVDIDVFTELPDGMPKGERHVFVIERFDRHPTGRIHTEDFGQILDRPPGDRQWEGDYAELAAQLAYLAPMDLERFIAQLVFCVLCGNNDAHLKNWSVIYPDGRSARLSPAYDLVAAILYFPKEGLALSLAGTRAFRDVHLKTFDRLAAACEQPEAAVRSWVKAAVERTLAAWHREQSELAYTSEEKKRISAHFGSVPLSRLE